MIEPDGSLVPPGKVIPAAERFRLMPDIDRWVVRNALEIVARRGPASGLAGFAINLSGQSLSRPELLEFVEREFLRSGAPHSLVTFEVTETAAIQNLANAARFIEAMHERGCKFALDDFGSGLSSFGYLKSIPVDYLKIDGTFVRNMLRSGNDDSIVVAIVQIAKALGIETVAECIEDMETLTVLRDIGVDYGQGYALHRPESVDTLVAVPLASSL
jgi:EAL domain-containing protein (putative c-di-GMP-specific phosphodiesterase class I)